MSRRCTASPVLETRRGAPAPQRSRELHARRQLHPRRGAGAARLLRRGRLQLGRHRLRRRRRAALAEWIVDGEPTARPLATSTSAASVPFQGERRLPARADASRCSASSTRCTGRAMSRDRRGRCAGRRCYDRLAGEGACFGTQMGWERANWFAPPAIARRTLHASARQNWFPACARRASRRARGRRRSSTRRRSPSSCSSGRDAGASAPAPLRQRRRRGAGPDRLHADAQRRGGIESDLHGHRAWPGTRS